MQWLAYNGCPINISLIKLKSAIVRKYYFACPVLSVATFPIFIKLHRNLQISPPPIIVDWS